ncbi:MAG: hypothetical protein BA873_10750 [Desulfobulbaceae bacterium C00003063]|nr:MAG: hypothetical protein BA873_10750 [Desulfobulbaceae bacterium C00003063]
MSAAKKTMFSVLGLTLSLLFQGSMSYAEKIEAVIEGKEVFITRNADNFIIMYDSSGSMDSLYSNTTMTSLGAERAILEEKNATLPNLGWQAGIFSFTPGFSLNALKNYLPVQPYDKELFSLAIDNLPAKPSGPTLLQGGLKELDDVLAGMSGQTALFLFTDGQYSHVSGIAKPGALAKTLASKYDLCFYVIDTQAEKEGDMTIRAIASANDCSKVIPFADLLGHPEWLTGALFSVQEKDGVEVVTDKETIIEVAEGNMIIEYEWKNILFDPKKATVRPDNYENLATIATFLLENPETRLILAGYADSIGTVADNKKLSERRAAVVRDFLIKKEDIDPSRITIRGFGEKDPVATNMYKAGRQQNRRVQGIIIGM